MGYHSRLREFRRQGYYPPTNLQQMNWVAQGAVSGVQNQHVCGSDWAFAAAGLVEASNFFENG